MKLSAENATFQYYCTGVTNTNLINLREILGNMYDKYDTFKIVCTNVGIYTTVPSFTGGNYTAIRLTGLNFIHSTYSSYDGSSSSAIMPFYFPFNPNTQSYFNNPGDSGVCFRKPDTDRINLMVDFGLAFKAPFTYLVPAVGAYVFNNNVMFSIYGLYD